MRSKPPKHTQRTGSSSQPTNRLWRLTHPRVIQLCLQALSKGQAIRFQPQSLHLPQGKYTHLSDLAHQTNLPIKQASKETYLEGSYLGAQEGAELTGAVQSKQITKLLMLDGVLDVGNLGACARSAYALGAQALVLPKHRSAPISEAAFRSSAGALALLPVYQTNSFASLIKTLSSELTFLGAEGQPLPESLGQNRPPMYALPKAPLPKDNWALIMGSEHDGMRNLVKLSCDFLVQIPLPSDMDSLNVSVASGILLHALANAS